MTVEVHYGDTYENGSNILRERRATQAYDHLNRLIGNQISGNVLEIGLGNGGVTQALIRLGATPSLAIDKDQRAFTTAEELCITFQEKDISEYTVIELDELLKSFSITTIIALRTAVPAMHQLLQKLSCSSFRGIVVGSIIEESEKIADSHVFRSSVIRFQGNILPLVQIPRLMTETGFVIDYQKYAR